MATNMYVKFEEPALETDMAAEGHSNEIEILSWNHGFSQPTSPVRASGGAGTVEQANHQNLSITKYLDGSTADLLKQCWTGKQFGKATLACYRADGNEANAPVKYLELILEHVVISNFSISGGPGDIPVETISLDYGIIQYNYTSQKRDSGSTGGNKSAKHDLETRKVS